MSVASMSTAYPSHSIQVRSALVVYSHKCLNFFTVQHWCRLYSSHIHRMSPKNQDDFEGVWYYGRQCYSGNSSNIAEQTSTTLVSTSSQLSFRPSPSLSSSQRASLSTTYTTHTASSSITSNSNSRFPVPSPSSRLWTNVTVSSLSSGTRGLSYSPESTFSGASSSPTSSSRSVIYTNTSSAMSDSITTLSSTSTYNQSSLLSSESPFTALPTPTIIAPTSCPDSSTLSPGSVDLVPLEDSPYSVGYSGLPDVFALARDGLPTAFLYVTNDSLYVLNSTVGSFGISTFGEIIYVAPNCSGAWTFGASNQSIVDSLVRRQTTTIPTRSTINVRLEILNYGGVPNTCPIDPILSCNDVSGSGGSTISNPAFSATDTNDNADYFGTCPFPEGPATDSCVATLGTLRSCLVLL